MPWGMIRTRSCLAAALAAATLATPAFATDSTAQASATLLSPLSVVNTDDLDFGTLVASGTSGTATVDPTTGSRSTSGGTVGLGGGYQPGVFVATGVFNRFYIVALGTPPTLTDGAGSTMVMTSLAIAGPNVGLFPSSKVVTIKVGGTLPVAANQTPGTYSGTYTLTVIYL